MSSSAVQFFMRNHVNLAKLSLGTGFLWGFAFTLQKGQTPFDAAQGASLSTPVSPSQPPHHPPRYTAGGGLPTQGRNTTDSR